MSDNLILCPLCKGEIPFDSTDCNFCGAVLAPGPNKHTPILKGVVCKNCGERNYGYDYCVKCSKPFVIDCPECGSNLHLSDQKCESCGLSIRKFNKLRKKDKPSSSRFDNLPIPKNYLLIAVSVISFLLVVSLLYSIFNGNDGDDGTVVEKSENPRLIDKNQDGIIDRWEHLNNLGMIDWIKEDLDGDGKAEKVSYLDSNQHVTKVTFDNDGDEDFEKVEFYRGGVLRMARHLEGADPLLTTKYEIYSAPGKLLYTYLDDNEDGVFEKHYQYDSDGRVHLEAFDSKAKGFMDTYIFYNRQKQIVARGIDADGDGVVERKLFLSSKGATIREDSDEDGDGWPEKRIFYHLSGKRRWIEYDTNKDGLFEKFESYTKEGKYARTGFDIDGDGKVDRWE